MLAAGLNDLYYGVLFFLYGSALLVFVALLFVSAPYGKFTRQGWGRRIDSQLAWVLMELPAVFVIALLAASGWLTRGHVGAGWVFLLMWELHYLYRTFLFPAGIRKGSKTFPVSMVVSAAVFNSLNGFVNGYHLFVLRPVNDLRWFLDPWSIAGVALFLGGFLLHVESDRRIQRQKPGPGEYIIPRGGAFSLVSCPNYLGEILQWFGWAMATRSPAGLAFAVFTFANVFPRALAAHRWYRETFADYPPERKAIVPWLL